MKKFKLLSLLLIISLFACLLPVQALAVADPAVAADSAIVMDTDTGNVLFEKNSGRTVSAGTLATLMTTLVVGDAVEDNSITVEDTVTASNSVQYNLAEGVSSAGIQPGETMTVNDLLYCVALASAADACNALAEYVSGSADAFVQAMNAKAQALGCSGTSFLNANGVDPAGQTNARDLAVIARALAESTVICTPFSSVSYTVSGTNMTEPRTLTNSNALLDSDSPYYYSYAYGFRNAALTDGGYSMVAAATYDDLDIVAVVLGCPDSDTRFSDARTLLDWVFTNFSYRQILSSTENLTTVPVEMGDPSSVGVRGEDAIRIILPNDQDLGQVDYRISYLHERENAPLQAPLEAAQYLGDVTVVMDGVERGTSRLVTASAVDISRLQYLRTQLQAMAQNESVRQLITILFIILGVYLLLVIFYFFQRVLHLHSLRRARKDRAIAQAKQEIQWLDIPEELDEPDQPIGYFQSGRHAQGYEDYPQDQYPPEDDYGDYQ